MVTKTKISKKRLLLDDEKVLLKILLEKAPPQTAKGVELDTIRVVDSGEAGARSIIFPDTRDEAQENGRLARPCVEAEYSDSDGVLVMVTLLTDQFGCLYEVDLWKVNFTNIQLLPDKNNLRFKQ